MPEAMRQPLSGRTIAFLESRRADDLTRLIGRAGGTPLGVPIVREAPVEDGGEIGGWLGSLARGEFDVAIFLTGGGCLGLLERAEGHSLRPDVVGALRRLRVVARGAKPARVLRQNDVPIAYVPPEPNTSDEILAELGAWDLAGKVVGLQVYGGPSPFLDRLRAGLRALDADVREVAPYRWEGPTDVGPVRDLIDRCLAGRVDALALLSSSHIVNLFAIAEDHRGGPALSAALNDPRIVIAAIGPVTARAVEEQGVRVDVVPEHPKMGHLVKALEVVFADR
ncbi:MAG: uroporphyrinogen-III synthase [Chloroflexota bacterium]